MKKKAIFVCGPTAVGKTSVAIDLAKSLDTEIISFDSRQFYKELEIGAAPPSKQELQEVKHHFIQHLELKKGEHLNAGTFEKQALKKLEEIFTKKNTAVLVGGSGLFMKAVLTGFDQLPEVGIEIRETLNKELQQNGLAPLVEELEQTDFAYAQTIDRNNPQRVIRSLEVIRQTGKPYSSFRTGSLNQREFDSIEVGLNLPREQLYERINLRVDMMIEAGLENEAKALYPFKDNQALQTVGYKEWWPYFEGKSNKAEVISAIKQNTRRYAKRQLTWFRNKENPTWFTTDEFEKIQNWINDKL